MTFKLMEIMQRRMATHRDEDEGATMVEYGLMVSLIAVICIAAVTLIGTRLAIVFNRVAAALPII